MTEDRTFMLISSSTFIVRAPDNTCGAVAFVPPNTSGDLEKSAKGSGKMNMNIITFS